MGVWTTIKNIIVWEWKTTKNIAKWGIVGSCLVINIGCAVWYMIVCWGTFFVSGLCGVNLADLILGSLKRKEKPPQQQQQQQQQQLLEPALSTAPLAAPPAYSSYSPFIPAPAPPPSEAYMSESSLNDLD
ncbi:hypothetical protein B0T21DRAFT_15589 [Apiosordaria backusii]|uniref:Uncharacterized protein n=1 Tax=Apiosordaria backusii TaxID=314023 RepID=A0AA40K6T5_9PEZI|nr:hypothetical protein B0T21DRAFT_15589 [Apiosordaria backusii]